MGVAKVVSIILKYVANGKINNEVIKDIADDFIDNGTDVGVDKVKQYIDKKKSEIDNILSRNYMLSIGIPEDEIGYIVAEVKSLFSEIEITDDLLIQCNYNCDKLSNHLLKEYHKINDIHIEYEIPIRSALFNVVKELINISLEDKDFVKKFLIQINNTADDTNSALKSLQQQGQVYHQEVMKRFDQMEGEPQNKNLELNEVKKFKNNKKSEYIKTWNSNLFLHSEENPKTLAETFVVPDFDLKCKISSISRLITKNLVAIIGKYINYDKSSNMLITGVPGIGKTSLIAKIANEYRDDERVIILRFRDWERSELKEGLLNAIYNTLKCEKEDLENKILILDGYDEIKVLDDVQNIINKFLVRLKDFDNFKCIITSRPTYIKSEYFANVIQLNRFKIGKVEEFYKRITDKVLENRKKIGLNLEVLGIPVILYMAIMSKIDISNNSSKPELYNRIFAVKGGIFDKFYDGVTEYSKGSQILRDPENIKIYLKFLETTAFMMYEKDTLSLYKEQCNIPKLEFEGKNISILDFPIKHLFEGVKSNNIEFIHKSIYEYFVAEYIFNLINEHIDDSNEDLAGVLGRYLINNKVLKKGII